MCTVTVMPAHPLPPITELSESEVDEPAPKRKLKLPGAGKALVPTPKTKDKPTPENMTKPSSKSKSAKKANKTAPKKKATGSKEAAAEEKAKGKDHAPEEARTLSLNVSVQFFFKFLSQPKLWQGLTVLKRPAAAASPKPMKRPAAKPAGLLH